MIAAVTSVHSTRLGSERSCSSRAFHQPSPSISGVRVSSAHSGVCSQIGRRPNSVCIGTLPSDWRTSTQGWYASATSSSSQKQRKPHSLARDRGIEVKRVAPHRRPCTRVTKKAARHALTAQPPSKEQPSRKELRKLVVDLVESLTALPPGADVGQVEFDVILRVIRPTPAAVSSPGAVPQGSDRMLCIRLLNWLLGPRDCFCLLCRSASCPSRRPARTSTRSSRRAL